MSDLVKPAKVQPLARLLSTIWLWPKREYLKRFRIGRTVTERVVGLDLIILPDVFNPVVFRTGKYFAEILPQLNTPAEKHANGQELRGLDVGSGCGILAITMAKLGLRVDAVDLNDEAVRCIDMNAEKNGVGDKVVAHHGDLFAPVAGARYDLITFHPPSFRGEPSSKFDLSWRSNDIFERFAADVPNMLKPGGIALVLQTSHGDEAGLLAALEKTDLDIRLVARKHMGVEIFSIYGLSLR